MEHCSTGNRSEPGDAVEHGAPETTVRVGPLADGFYLEDTGTGTTATDRRQVADAMQGAPDDAFGLRIVSEIVDRHEWSVSVDESDAGGLRFEFRGIATLS